METVEELLDLLELEYLDDNLYRGQNYKAPWGRVFGGQVLAQSLNAARRTTPEGRSLHSMHGYFILGGDLNHPIIYQVDCIRDGRSFTTRRVVAYQKGRAIFNMSASFQIEEEGLSHQISMPDIPGPEELISDEEWYRKNKDILPGFSRVIENRPIEFRPVKHVNPMDTNPEEPIRHIWLKAKSKLPDAQSIHREVMAYAADYNLMTTSLLPHRGNFRWEQMQLASLDHAMWYYQDFRMDEWLLYSLDSPVSGHSRGLGRGNFFTQDGRLVAAVAQEGLIRKRS